MTPELWPKLCTNERCTPPHIQRHLLKLCKHGIKLKCTLGGHSSGQIYYEVSPPNSVGESMRETETDINVNLGKAQQPCPEETTNAHAFLRLYVQKTDRKSPHCQDPFSKTGIYQVIDVGKIFLEGVGQISDKLLP